MSFETAASDAAAPAAVELAAESTAVYLARRMCADRGFAPGTFPEAQALLPAADLVLTKANGVGVEIVCILDRDADPARQLGVDRDALIAIGEACAPHAGKVGSTKMPVAIHVWEVGRGADLDRVRALAARRLGSRVMVHAWALDTASGSVTTTAALKGRFMGRPYLERALREPRRTGDAWERPEPALPPERRPIVTGGLIAVLVACFVLEQVFAVRPAGELLAPDLWTLHALGGLFRPAIDDGEWYRLLTAAFLHGDLVHLLLNGIALAMAGVVLEGLFGRAWLLALFFLGALGGAALSYLLNDANVISVGASGAIMGLLAAALVSTFRLPDEGQRVDMQMALARILIPSLIPLAMHRGEGGSIDYAAHVGGALVGGVVGVLLLRTWRLTDPVPRFRAAAALVALAGTGAAIAGAVLIARDYHGYVESSVVASYQDVLMPDESIPDGDHDDLIQRAETLVAQFPRDPRAQLFNAVRLERKGDLAGAERALRTGLAERDLLATMFSSGALETGLRASLAELLLHQDRRPEAVEAAAPSCKSGPGGTVPEALQSLNVCP